MRKACFVLEIRSFPIYEKMTRRNVRTTGKASPILERNRWFYSNETREKNVSAIPVAISVRHALGNLLVSDVTVVDHGNRTGRMQIVAPCRVHAPRPEHTLSLLLLFLQLGRVSTLVFSSIDLRKSR